LKKFENLPEFLKTDEVRPYYDILKKKKGSLFFKRTFEILFSLFFLLLLSLPLFLIALIIKLTSKGPVFFRQTRVGRYGRDFKIFKFRTMVKDADKIGSQLTVGSRDPRITSCGHFLRKLRLDEIPQLINILIGNMCLIGTRPEVRRYVDRYTNEMNASLLLPPGLTGNASIEFSSENDLLAKADDPEQYYIDEILPVKMKINLDYIKTFSFWSDVRIIFKTVFVVVKKS